MDLINQATAHWYLEYSRVCKDRDKYRTIAARAARALKRTGIVGIYAEFTGLPDAINQFGLYTKEIEAKRDALQAQLEAAEGLAQELIDFEDNEALPSAALAAWHAAEGET